MKNFCIIILVFWGFGCPIRRCYGQELPIKVERNISFETDEGSYMNVDLSSDGKKILFDLLGNIYYMPLDGKGKAMQLTDGIALNLRPVWSPDGNSFAYVSDSCGKFYLHVRSLKGEFSRVLGKHDKELYYGIDPIWTPDGRYIVLGRFTYGIYGGKIENNSIWGGKRILRFSENGKKVYFFDSSKVCVYDYLKNRKEVISEKLDGGFGMRLSPDLRWLVYIDIQGKSCLMAYDLKNNSSHILRTTLVENNSHYEPSIPIRHYCISSDSKDVILSYGGKIHRISIETGKDVVVPFTTKVNVGLGKLNYNTFRLLQDSVRVKYTRSANMSPDKMHLVFTALGKIYVMDVPNGKPHVLVNQSLRQFQPVYSPDGKWIAYVSWSDSLGGALWKVPAEGGTPECLSTTSGLYTHPAWSPDGNSIAFVRGAPVLLRRDDAGSGKIILFSLDTRKESILNEDVPLWNQLIFSLSGKQISYSLGQDPDDEQTFKIVNQDLNSGYKELHSMGNIKTFFPQFSENRSLSPDGETIVFNIGEDLFIRPVYKLPQPTLLYDPSLPSETIRIRSGIDPYWEEGGKVLCWTYGNKFYKVTLRKILSTAAEEYKRRDASSLLDSSITTISIVPDQTITMNVTVPGKYGVGTAVLNNVKIITMNKEDKIIENGAIVINNGRIMSVGPADQVRIPKNAFFFNLKGTTVLPGLIDLHDHMSLPHDIFYQQHWMQLANLAYGVTTARNPATSLESFGYEELLKSGQMKGPRLFGVGHAVQVAVFGIRCDNIFDANDIVNKRKEYGGKIVKQYTLPSRIQRQMLLMACERAGLNMTNEGNHDPILQIGMIKDGSTGVEHNPEFGDAYKDIITFYGKSGTFLTPTLQVVYGRIPAREFMNYQYWHKGEKKLERFTVKTRLEDIKKFAPPDTLNPEFLLPAQIDYKIYKMGGAIGMGSHGEDEGIGAHNEIWSLCMGGFSNLEALKAGTIVGAEALGLQKDLGSIEVGKIADLIILNKDPLEDIHNSKDIRFVMKDGILYDSETLSEIWPKIEEGPKWRGMIQ